MSSSRWQSRVNEVATLQILCLICNCFLLLCNMTFFFSPGFNIIVLKVIFPGLLSSSLQNKCIIPPKFHQLALKNKNLYIKRNGHLYPCRL